FVLRGPGRTGVHQGARTGAGDDFDVSGHLRGSVGSERSPDQYDEQKHGKPNAHVNSPSVYSVGNSRMQSIPTRAKFLMNYNPAISKANMSAMPPPRASRSRIAARRR